jgi:citrate lyase beta subunit
LTHTRPHRIRSMLFVPATRWNMIEKASQSEADAICLDLEDSVAPNEKQAARQQAIRAFGELDFGQRTRMLRINALDTPFAYRDLIEVVEAAGSQLDVIMLPKANQAADVQFVDTLLSQIELACGFTTGRIGIEAQIETARGCLNVATIAAASSRLEALIYGPGDFAASMHMPLASIGEADQHDALYPGHRWHYVMQSIIVAARAYGLRCMDGPFAGIRDAEGFAKSCQIARSLGFDGKQCIHPTQLAMVNQAFAPSEAEITWAREVVATYEAALQRGEGAIRIGERMIDAASIRMAQAMLGI